MHLVIYSARSLGVGIVPLWCKDKFTCKLGVTKEGPDALNDVTVVELEGFTPNNKILALKGRAGPGQRLVDYAVQLCTGSIR
jgi:hypothetical protein